MYLEKLEYKRSRTSNKNRNVLNENLKNSKNKKNVVNKKHKKKKILFIFIILFITLLVIGGYLLFTLPTFNLEAFQIEGTDRYSNDEIIEKLGLKKGENIFIQLLKRDQNNINSLSYIQSVNINIVWPNKLDIKITERVSVYFAFDKEKNKFYKIDKEGYILEEGNITEKTNNELLVYGFIFDDEVILGSRIKEVDISKINIFNNIKEEFDKNSINGSITKVNFENSLTTITLNDKLNVIFPNDTDIEYKMSFFKSILSKIGEDSVGVIDMTKTDPVFSSF